MDAPNIRQIILDIIVDIGCTPLGEVSISDVEQDKPLREQFDLDSMAFLDMVMELRKHYGIEVPEEDYAQLESLDGCEAYLLPKLTSK